MELHPAHTEHRITRDEFGRAVGRPVTQTLVVQKQLQPEGQQDDPPRPIEDEERFVRGEE